MFKTILVIGACSKVGKKVTFKLLDLDFRVIVVVRSFPEASELYHKANVERFDIPVEILGLKNTLQCVCEKYAIDIFINTNIFRQYGSGATSYYFDKSRLQSLDESDSDSLSKYIIDVAVNGNLSFGDRKTFFGAK